MVFWRSENFIFARFFRLTVASAIKGDFSAKVAASAKAAVFI